MKVLVFDIWGDYAHFRKFYTTTSPLTFSFPPPPTIAGILGAICGTTKETNQHIKIFGSEQCLLALRIINPVKKIRLGLNLIDTKKGWTPKVRTQIRTEFVKDPRYRVYFFHYDKEIYNDVANNIKEHRTVYTISLGLSELLGDFQYVGEWEAKSQKPSDFLDIVTPIVEENLQPKGLTIETGKKYIKEKLPIVMNPQRIVEKYDEVLFEPDGKTIRAKVKDCWQLNNGENIAFFRSTLPSGDIS